MKKKEQRINEIYSFLQESPSLSVKDLSEMLNVSEMTIRRDLKYLKENNLFVRSHGIQLPVNDKSMITNIESEYTLHSEFLPSGCSIDISCFIKTWVNSQNS